MNVQHQSVLVVGLGRSGQAAASLLHRRGARVVAVDQADHDSLRHAARELAALGIDVRLGVRPPLAGRFDLAVLSPGVPTDHALVRDVLRQGVPLLGEMELGCRWLQCPCLGITGTNGKTTTTELAERVLLQAGRRTVAAGNIGLPVCAVVEQSADYDWLTLEVSSFQLETVEEFHPRAAVLLNLTPDHLDRYAGLADYLRAKARIFARQTPEDWAIVQLEALAQMRALNLPIPARLITFSAARSDGDLYLDRGVIHCRLDPWQGPLLDMRHGRLRGPHNAENLMAVLALALALDLPRSPVVEALQSYSPAPHRCEWIAEIKGVQFINDSKATNVDAVAKAIQAMPQAERSGPNIWLIAGGKDKGLEFHELGPLLGQRVKGAFLIGEMRHKMLAAWDLYTRCELADDVATAVQHAAERAVPGDIVLLSPACSSFDQFRDYQHRGEVFKSTVLALQNTIDSGCIAGRTQHNVADVTKPAKPGNGGT